MTSPVTTEALRTALVHACFDPGHVIGPRDGRTMDEWRGDACMKQIAPLLAALQQVTAERDEAQEKICSACPDALVAQDQAAENDGRARTAEASLATATSELARLRAEGEAKDRRVAALEAALAPFAKAGGLFGPRQSNGWDVLIYSPAAGDEYCITADHLRAARAATAREG